MDTKKKKIKKKALLRRIEDLEYKLLVLKDKVAALGQNIQLPTYRYASDHTQLDPICPQCGIDPNRGGTCTSTNCPYSLKITC
jgi:hypothetical protein